MLHKTSSLNKSPKF